MKQVALKIYRITNSGNVIQESTGRGFLADGNLLVAMQTTGDAPKAYLKQFDVSKITAEYKGWYYGNTTYCRKTPDGEIIIENWHVSYMVLGEC